jgi:hypothetical protein
MNNCYNCPFRKPIAGNAHSQCTFFGEGVESFHIGLRLQVQPTKQFKNGDEVVLEFDPIGIENGWCMWPINFDPTWVKCNLPLNQEQ